ncbi:MAG: Sec63 [Thelocarpon superellum]|nr:MAG: Sec63 [Thelocarpon superellum]
MEHPQATPTIRGIQTVSTTALPDRFRSVFPFPLFNAMQSRCFHAVYQTNENFVLASPTGSGKTAIMELAICRLLASLRTEPYKIVYQAPTKSLCAERHRDWQAKFAPQGLHCAQLTGDTDSHQLRRVQTADLIITTPEKWDSMTRRWKDHLKLVQMVKLFLIDEVHTLRETRGATLEALVSRMKSVVPAVRFVALSATIPNAHDLAVWLGRDAAAPHMPAHQEVFGEEFRPVKLQKFVYGYQSGGANDFAFDKLLGSRLPEVIRRHSASRPIMIFCGTRNAATVTATALAALWTHQSPQERSWPFPSQILRVRDRTLLNCVVAGVAFHHAGLDSSIRRDVEQAYLAGWISVICCTSTLAVGVNLPCHLVILKNTTSWQNGGLFEYTDLEVMQMLGRAGRPQFDTTGVAVIMTRSEKVQRYERMTSGQDAVESCLHLNLTEHLVMIATVDFRDQTANVMMHRQNAEISLGTIQDEQTAKRWLQSTFLYVRVAKNPGHYKLDGQSSGAPVNEGLERIGARETGRLCNAGLVLMAERLQCTALGHAMARYCVRFGSMRSILSLQARPRMSEILSALAAAEEFHEIRLKAAEKGLYRELNRASEIRFPIKVDLALPAHKSSLILQATLGGVDFPALEALQKHCGQFQMDLNTAFQHAQRLIRCIVDCLLDRGDAVGVRHGLELTRSLAARVWDHSPLQMTQIEGIGNVSVRKLLAGGIEDLEALRQTKAARIETLMHRNPPYGHTILTRVEAFPQLHIGVKLMARETVEGRPDQVQIKLEIGFFNDPIPRIFNRRPIYVCYLAETEDGRILDFGRISARAFIITEWVLFTTPVTSAGETITCTATCDEIGPLCTTAATCAGSPPGPAVDAYDDGALDDEDFFVALSDLDFQHIDSFGAAVASTTRRNTVANRSPGTQVQGTGPGLAGPTGLDPPLLEPPRVEPPRLERRRLENGRWTCGHRCKHKCCQEGVSRPRGVPEALSEAGSTADDSLGGAGPAGAWSGAAESPPGSSPAPSPAPPELVAEPEKDRVRPGLEGVDPAIIAEFETCCDFS